MRKHFISFFRFAQVAAFATLIDYGIGYYLVTFLQQNPTKSTIIGNLVGGIVAYICCKQWVFPTENTVKNILQITKFASVNVGNLALNVIGVWLFTKYSELNYLAMRVLVGAIVFIIYSYGANKWLVFNKSF